MKAVIYARYSSDNQREESIEGQLRECMEFEHIYDTNAGCTVSCHCGEGCLGILYIHKKA